jgi:U3 small nucleolar RNA-associated protein 13
VKVWDIENGYCTHNFRGHEGLVTKVIFHPDPHRMQLFSLSNDSTIRVWDLVSNTNVVLTSHMSEVTCIAFHGWDMISGGHDRVINVWNLRNNTLKKTIPIYEVNHFVILP